MNARLLGLDVGTSVIKAVVFDLDGGEIGGAAHAVEVQTPHPGWTEQDMEAVWEAAAAAIRDAVGGTGGAGEIAAVAVAGQGDGAWMIDAEGRPVAPAPLWSDARASSVVDGWLASGALSRLYERGGHVLV